MPRRSYRSERRTRDLSWVAFGLTSLDKATGLLSPSGDFPNFMSSDGTNVIFTRPCLLRAASLGAVMRSRSTTPDTMPWVGVAVALPDAKPTIANTPKRFPVVLPGEAAFADSSGIIYRATGRSKAMRKIERGQAVHFRVEGDRASEWVPTTGSLLVRLLIEVSP